VASSRAKSRDLHARLKIEDSSVRAVALNRNDEIDYISGDDMFPQKTYLTHMKLIGLILTGLLMTMATASAEIEFNDKIYDAKSITLPNAMQVVVIENPRTPAVTHMVWYKIGGADEAMGESGLAHYLEHLMFKGTDLVASGDFSKKVKAWGGNDNAFTSWDFTAYFQTVPKDKLESVMIMEADRMKGLTIDEADALTERDVVIQERKERTDSNPAAQLSESMRSALFVNHPYARPIIGWDEELRKLTPEAAREFYKKYYAPKNAIMVVSGDVQARDVFELAAKYYGDIDNDKALTRPEWPQIPDIKGDRMITLSHEDVQQPVWRRMYVAPGMGQDYETSLALTLAEEILGGNTGRLYKALVIDQKIASSANLSYNPVSVNYATASIGVVPMDNVSASQIESAIENAIENLVLNGVEEDELRRAVSRIQDESVYERDSLTGPAMMVGYQLVSGLSLDKIERWTKDLENITSADIQNALSTYLLPEADNYRAVTGYLVPKELNIEKENINEDSE
jgi:zinc protease